MIFRSPLHFSLLAICVIINSQAKAADKSLDTAKIDQITAAKGVMNKDEGVYKVSFPRSDVKVTVDGTELPPFMGLTSWAAFQNGSGTEAMVMGDMVLFQDEVNPAMDAAFANGLTVTGLHNHFFFDEPRVFFMHIGGEGSTDQLATGVRRVLDEVKKVRSAKAQPGNRSGNEMPLAKSAIVAAPLAALLGAKPMEKDGMVKFTIGRTTRMPCGCEVGKEMGVNTWAAFMGSDERAIVDGDFVTFEGELQPVLKALRSNHLNIVAIHNHMEGENPKAIFLHYWGVGAALDLARGVKAALDAQSAHGKSS